MCDAARDVQKKNELSEQFALLSCAQVLFGRENRQLIRQRASNGCHVGDDFDATVLLSVVVLVVVRSPEFRVVGVYYWGRFVVKSGGFAAHGLMQRWWWCRLPGFLGGFFRGKVLPPFVPKTRVKAMIVLREESIFQFSLFFQSRENAREHIVTSFDFEEDPTLTTILFA